MLCVVAPLLHNQDAPADAVNVTLPPAQNVVGPPADMDALHGAVQLLTTIDCVAVLLQPFAFV